MKVIKQMTATRKKALSKSYGYCLARTFSMSAIGHESDFLLSDLVADLRASTPSNAMEILPPSSDEWLQRLDGFNVKLHRSFKILLHQKKAHLEHLAASFREEKLPS
ncbi:hypothetical protein Yangon179_12900 [Helicobacter pylori]